jgi:hypothetical protein
MARSRVTVHPAIKEGDQAGGNPIHLNPKHKGLLHQELGVPAGEPIPQGKIKAAEHSSNPKERKRAFFADTAEHKFKH